MTPSPSAVPLSLKIAQLIDSAGGSPHAELLVAFIKTILRTRNLTYGDVKLLHRTVRELRYAFSVYERYRHVRKITIFGSARTSPTLPVYYKRRMILHPFCGILSQGVS